MARKKKHPEHVNNERWLVSYADFITLLFAFFVVLFASSQVDRSKSKKMALAIESAFERFSIFKEQSGDSIEADERGGSGGNAKKFREYLLVDESGRPIILPPELDKDPETLQVPTGDPKIDTYSGFIGDQERALARVHRNLLTILEKKKINNKLMVTADDRGILISVQEAVLFEPDSTKISKGAKEALEAIGQVISVMSHQIRVEGHTDAGETEKEGLDNWKISIDRSVAVVKWFINEFKMNPKRFIVVGYGQYRPVVYNDTEDNRKKNRRVDIVLLSPKAGAAEAPLNIKKEKEEKRKKERQKEHPFGEALAPPAQ